MGLHLSRILKELGVHSNCKKAIVKKILYILIPNKFRKTHRKISRKYFKLIYQI